MSSTGSLLGFPSKARLLHLLATILDEPTWLCSFQPWFISISYFYRCHQSLCAVLMDVSMNHQTSDCRTAPDTTASSPPDPPSQLQSSPSRTGSRILIPFQHPRWKTGTIRSVVDGTGRFQLGQTLATDTITEKCAVTNNECLNQVSLYQSSLLLLLFEFSQPRVGGD